MLSFITELKVRNEAQFYFGLACTILALVFLILSKVSSVQVNNVSAWYKPFKFAASIAIYAFTMAWYCHYLSNFNTKLFNLVTISLLAFEIIYIAVQAGKVQLSHFNISTTFYSIMYNLMAVAASVVALYTAYVGVLFFTGDFPQLSTYYLWAIRWGLVLFVIFSFEGFLMGARLSHTIGGADGGPGLPVLNWSTKFGDPRIAHFIGMHALQVLPLLSYYMFQNTKATFITALLYFALAVFTLVQAVQGKPFVRTKTSGTESSK
jgi:hypothetical protein